MKEPKQDRRLLPKQTVVVEGEECALIPLTQGRFAIVDAGMFDELNKWQWRRDKWYATRTTRVSGKVVLVFMHRVVAGTPPELETDHINRNGLDNRRSNLRDATHAQNQHNTSVPRNNKLGVKGVTKGRNKFIANIGHDGKRIHIGTFNTIEQAVSARDSVARSLHGEFAYRP